MFAARPTPRERIMLLRPIVSAGVMSAVTYVKRAVREILGEYLSVAFVKTKSKSNDEDGIRTHACRAHWISSSTP